MLSIMPDLRFRGQIKVCFRRRIWQVCPCAVIMAAMRFCAMCLRIMLLSLMLPLLPLRRRVRLPLRQADWELRLLRRWRVMLCRRRWCDSSLLMRSCILIRRCIGVRSINYRLQRRGFWSFSEILTKRKKTPTFFRTRALFFCFYSFGASSSAFAADFGTSASAAGTSAFTSASATGAAAISSSTTDCCTNCSFSSAVRI